MEFYCSKTCNLFNSWYSNCITEYYINAYYYIFGQNEMSVVCVCVAKKKKTEWQQKIAFSYIPFYRVSHAFVRILSLHLAGLSFTVKNFYFNMHSTLSINVYQNACLSTYRFAIGHNVQITNSYKRMSKNDLILFP